jgi:hypothetical protein
MLTPLAPVHRSSQAHVSLYRPRGRLLHLLAATGLPTQVVVTVPSSSGTLSLVSACRRRRSRIG